MIYYAWLLSDAAVEMDDYYDDMYCPACDKSFKSDKAWVVICTSVHELTFVIPVVPPKSTNIDFGDFSLHVNDITVFTLTSVWRTMRNPRSTERWWHCYGNSWRRMINLWVRTQQTEMKAMRRTMTMMKSMTRRDRSKTWIFDLLVTQLWATTENHNRSILFCLIVLLSC